MNKRQMNELGLVERHAVGKLDGQTGWEVRRAIRPRGKRNRRAARAVTAKNNAERAGVRCTPGPALPQPSAACGLAAGLLGIGHPEQLEECIAKEKAPVGRSLARVGIGRTLRQTEADERIPFRRTRRTANERMIEFERHGRRSGTRGSNERRSCPNARRQRIILRRRPIPNLLQRHARQLEHLDRLRLRLKPRGPDTCATARQSSRVAGSTRMVVTVQCALWIFSCMVAGAPLTPPSTSSVLTVRSSSGVDKW